MSRTVLGLAAAVALGLSIGAMPSPVEALTRNVAPTVYPLGPDFAYWPAYYVYVPARPGPYAPGYAAVPLHGARYVLFDDVYPPAIYGPRLRPVGGFVP